MDNLRIPAAGGERVRCPGAGLMQLAEGISPSYTIRTWPPITLHQYACCHPARLPKLFNVAIKFETAISAECNLGNHISGLVGLALD